MARAANARIIPITVPSRPTRVPSVVIVAITGRFCSRVGSSSAVASSRRFLDRSYALFFVQGFVFLYLRIGLKSRQNYVGNRTALFCAECTGAFQVVFLEAVFHVADELGQVTAAVGFADGEPALNAQYEYGEEQGLQNRYDDTSFIDSTQHVARQRRVDWGRCS